MSQFDVYENLNQQTRPKFPFVLDVQHGEFRELNSRLVIPLLSPKYIPGMPLTHLTPLLWFARDEYLLLTPLLAAIPLKQLGQLRGTVTEQQEAVLIGIDTLINGCDWTRKHPTEIIPRGRRR